MATKLSKHAKHLRLPKHLKRRKLDKHDPSSLSATQLRGEGYGQGFTSGRKK